MDWELNMYYIIFGIVVVLVIVASTLVILYWVSSCLWRLRKKGDKTKKANLLFKQIK